jgi:hypothetical protein
VFPVETEDHLRLDDARVLTAMTDAARGDASTVTEVARDAARRIVERRHFKVAWSRNKTDIERNVDAARLIYSALCDNGDFDPDLIRLDSYRKTGSRERKDRKDDFPVLQSDGSTVWASAISTVVENLPPVAIEYVFVAPEIRDRATTWLAKHKHDILSHTPKEEEP